MYLSVPKSELLPSIVSELHSLPPPSLQYTVTFAKDGAFIVILAQLSCPSQNKTIDKPLGGEDNDDTLYAISVFVHELPVSQ